MGWKKGEILNKTTLHTFVGYYCNWVMEIIYIKDQLSRNFVGPDRTARLGSARLGHRFNVM